MNNDTASNFTSASSAPAQEAIPAQPSIFSLIGAAHALEAKLEDALGTVGLSSAKYAVLKELVGAGTPLALSELATRLSCVRSNMTQLVDRLEADGLVQRVTCASDRRLVKAEITYPGREKQAAGEAEVGRVEGEFAAQVRPEDRELLTRLLASIR